jgi:hypothetical protein
MARLGAFGERSHSRGAVRLFWLMSVILRLS